MNDNQKKYAQKSLEFEAWHSGSTPEKVLNGRTLEEYLEDCQKIVDDIDEFKKHRALGD
jgi:hypothetical protein